MRFRKTLLLTAMAMVAVASAAPGARADAPEWLHDGQPIAGVEELHIVGSISWTTGGGFVSGPCTITLEGAGANVFGMAAGTITNGEIQKTCNTTVSTCFVKPTLNFSEGNWSLTGTTVTDHEGVEIEGISITKTYEGTNCPVPVPTLTSKGTATGFLDELGCVSLEFHFDDMTLTLGPIPVDLRGGLCDTTLTLG